MNVAGPPTPALDALQALAGVSRLVRRSATLDGALPLRAAQHCLPLVSGSSAGFQIELATPMTVRRRASGVVEVCVDASFSTSTRDRVAAALDAAVDAGVLRRDGYWNRIFRRDACPVRGDRLVLWTGWFVRPAPGLGLVVSGAYNRRSGVMVGEHVVVGSERFVPLVLQIDLSTIGDRPVTIERELGCVTPVSLSARCTVERLEAAPEVGARAVAFYDASYFREKAKKPTSRYRKVQASLEASGPPEADCRFVYAGPRVLAVTSRWRRAGPDGWSWWAPSERERLDQVVVRSMCAIATEWDGHTLGRPSTKMPRARNELADGWRKAFGAPGDSAHDFFSRYCLRFGPHEPYLLVQPWLFVATPPGWSVIVDGFHGRGYEGLRGVIATDALGTVSMVYRVFRSGRLRIAADTELLRVLPVPRAVLARPLRRLDAPDVTPDASGPGPTATGTGAS